MIYPANFEEKIGFTSICNLLREECLSSLGLFHVDHLTFLTDFEELQLILKQTDEFKKMLLMEGAFPAQDFYNMQPVLKQLQIEGAFIEQDALKDLQVSLKTIFHIQQYLEALEEEKYQNLKLLLEGLIIPSPIMEEMDRIIDNRGMISDHASPELAEIRKNIRKKQGETDRRIRQVLIHAKKEGWVEESAEPSIRNERLVLPILAGSKRKLKGFVHDISTTGQTVFIEPEDIFDLNNAIRELENDERLEIIRILKTFTAFLRPFLPDLLYAYEFLGRIDFLRAKAKIAIRLQAVMPLLTDQCKIAWIEAKHPLLFLSLEKQQKSVVPLNIRLDEPHRILIISGPNAGGKSVCLKTVGLLQYMLQCGLLVPMRETSEAGIFHEMFIDMGDEQSLENDLSTYSSHLKNMKTMVAHATNKTLFLSDELGSGTEPQVGGAIAESILENLNERKAFGIVTTHYANLKLMANEHKEILNGAMLFDTKLIKPLYILQTGMPGSSFAFELAKNIGLQTEILKKASQKIGSSHLQFEQQLQQLEVEKKQLEQKENEWLLADKLLSETLEKYQKLSSTIENKRNEIIHQAKIEAKQIIARSNQLVEQTIREIKENQAEKESTKKIREHFEQEAEMILENPSSNISEKSVKSVHKKQAVEKKQHNKPIQVGDYVRVVENGTPAEVLQIANGKATIAVGLMKLSVPVQQLISVGREQLPKQNKQNSFGGLIADINQRKTSFNPSIDIRGMNAEEAIETLTKFFDDAVLFAEKHLTILHGKGNGILRRLVKDLTQHNKDVKQIRYEHPDRGGDGITIVEMK